MLKQGTETDVTNYASITDMVTYTIYTLCVLEFLFKFIMSPIRLSVCSSANFQHIFSILNLTSNFIKRNSETKFELITEDLIRNHYA